MNIRNLIVVLSSILTLCACEHTVDEPIGQSGLDITFADIRDTVFSACLPCHSGTTISGGLDLSSVENLIDVYSNGVPAYVYIKPNEPDSSYIYMKIINDPRITGGKMPPTGSLSDKNVSTLRNWIINGAP